MAIPIPEKYTNRLLGSDIEANGLLEKVTKLWCICSIDVVSEEVFLFHDYPEYDGMTLIDPDDDLEYTIPVRNGTFAEGVEFWQLAADNGSTLIVHNCGSYDKPLLERFYPDFKTELSAWEDTYVISKIQWHGRPTPKGSKGNHGLHSYGIRLGVDKPEIKDWSFIDEFKLHRCIQDCKIQNQTHLYLNKERDVVLNKLGIDLRGGLEMEDEYRKNVTDQEINGALVDESHIDSCIVDLDGKLEELRSDIEPQLIPTLTKSTKVGRQEIGQMLYNKDIPDIIDVYYKDGERVEEVVKTYYRPSVNFTKTVKGKNITTWSGFETSCGFTPEFKTKKDTQAWIKENHPETRASIWEFNKGVTKAEDQIVLNKNTCDYFGVDETDIDMFGLRGYTRIGFKPSTMSQHEAMKSTCIKLGWKYAEDWNLAKDRNGDFYKAEYDIEVRWPSYASPENQIVKKVKKGKYVVSTPKLTEDDYQFLPEGLGEDISHYNTYKHRRNFFSNIEKPEEKGLKAHIRPNGRISCGVNNFNCASGRATQSLWVNVAGEKSLYGEECRKTIIAPENRILVGADMNSAQLSIAAYYANNFEYFKAVVDGNEFKMDEKGTKIPHPVTGKDWYIGESGHCVNARAFTLTSEEEWKRAVEFQDADLIHKILMLRGKSKGGSFACLPVHNTEVLTRDGWKFYKDLKEGVEILTYNKTTKLNEFQSIKKLHYFEDKEVIKMENNEWCMESTPDHRWLGKRRTGRGETRREIEEFLTTDEIKSEFKIYNSAPFKGNSGSIVSEDEAELLGWIFGDGHIYWSAESFAPSTAKGTKRGVKCVITQNDNKFSKNIEELTKRLGCLTGKTYKKGSINPCANYNIKASYVRELWYKCGFPCESLQNIDLVNFMLKLDNKCLTSFMKSFYEADGHIDNNGGLHVTQNKGNILDGVLTALTLLGINYSVVSKGIYEPSGNECVDVRYRKKTYTGSTKFVKTSLGVMPTFCVTTDNSTFVCKQGDNVSITGNCIFGATGKRVAQTLGIDEKLGTKSRNAFLESIGLDRVFEILNKMCEKYSRAGGGYIELPFGYYAHCKDAHARFNYLDQGTEAACQKYAVNYFTRESKRLGLDCFKILDIHDEFLVESAPDVARDVGELMCKSYKEASLACWEWHKNHSKWFVGDDLPTFSFNLDGGYSTGQTYYDCH